jgi:hypothetical protein
MAIRHNDLVRIGRNKRVYRVEVAPRPGGNSQFYLAADAKHPDAAKRVPDAYRWYDEHELTPVSGEMP